MSVLEKETSGSNERIENQVDAAIGKFWSQYVANEGTTTTRSESPSEMQRISKGTALENVLFVVAEQKISFEDFLKKDPKNIERGADEKNKILGEMRNALYRKIDQIDTNLSEAKKNNPTNLYTIGILTEHLTALHALETQILDRIKGKLDFGPDHIEKGGRKIQ